MKKKETYELETWDIIWVLSRRFIEYDEIFRARVINVKYEQALDEWDYEWIVYLVQLNCTENCVYEMDEDLKFLRCTDLAEQVHSTELYHSHDKGFIDEWEATRILKDSIKNNLTNNIERTKRELDRLNKMIDEYDDRMYKKIKSAKDTPFWIYQIF